MRSADTLHWQIAITTRTTDSFPTDQNLQLANFDRGQLANFDRGQLANFDRGQLASFDRVQLSAIFYNDTKQKNKS